MRITDVLRHWKCRQETTFAASMLLLLSPDNNTASVKLASILKEGVSEEFGSH